MTKEEFAELIKKIKNDIRPLNAGWTDGWLVGGSMTVADVMVASILSLPFFLLLDEGFRKPCEKIYKWYERVAANPDMKACCGTLRIGSKAVTPVFAAGAEKKPKAA